MSDLHPCPACHRHIRASETACPFCDAPREVAPESRPMALGRLTRAAVFAGAAILGTATAACGGSQNPSTGAQGGGSGESGSAGGPAEVADAGAPGEEATKPDPEPDRVPEPDHNIPMPYGAPPVPARLV